MGVNFKIAAIGLLIVNMAIWSFVLIRWLRRRRHWLAAFLEQGRVESIHHTRFRDDQRINALQQRLARTLGKRHAFSLKTRRRLERELARMKR